jgi:RNA polymerase sigma-70 factor, ECF subfamily
MTTTDDTTTDAAVVAKTLQHPETFGVLIERYEAKLARYIHRLGVHTREDQQDVLQEIFIKTYRNLNNFDKTLAFSSWIYRIAHNEAITWYRKQSVRPEGHLIADSEEVFNFIQDANETPDVEFDQKINAVTLNKALNVLEAKYKDALILRFFEHKEYDEISDILKIPTGSVGTLIHRGKKLLYNELNREALRI